MERQQSVRTGESNQQRPIPSALAQSKQLQEHPLQRLQRRVGNRAVGRLLTSGRLVGRRLQAQLRVGASDDPYEHEADSVADAVMRMPEPSAQRMCAGCEEEEEGGVATSTVRRTYAATPSPVRVRRQDTGTNEPSDAPQIVSEVVAGAGRPLDSNVRRFMEPRFGHDFSGVQIHTGGRAAESARAVNAVAYTVGPNVVFDEGAYRPETDAGRRLIAHELTHVVQQGAADASVEPESENEEGDSSTLHADRGVQPFASSDRRVQRQAACYCCITDVAIKNISRIDTPSRMGHSFDFEIKMARATEHGPRLDGECTLEWWEKISVPAIPGHPPNVWTDMFQLAPTSPTFNPWNNRATACDTNSTVTINDPPALGRRPGRTVTRTLEFDLKVKSGPGSTCSGDRVKSATASQVLTMVNGAPDWANSSFT